MPNVLWLKASTTNAVWVNLVTSHPDIKDFFGKPNSRFEDRSETLV